MWGWIYRSLDFMCWIWLMFFLSMYIVFFFFFLYFMCIVCIVAFGCVLCLFFLFCFCLRMCWRFWVKSDFVAIHRPLLEGKPLHSTTCRESVVLSSRSLHVLPLQASWVFNRFNGSFKKPWRLHPESAGRECWSAWESRYYPGAHDKVRRHWHQKGTAVCGWRQEKFRGRGVIHVDLLKYH